MAPQNRNKSIEQAGLTPIDDDTIASWQQLEDAPSGAAAYAELLSYEKFKGSRVSLVEPAKSFIEVNEDGEIVFNMHEGQRKLMASAKRFVIALASRQSGKCGRFEVLLSNGRRVFVRDVKVGDEILSLDEKTLAIKPMPVTALWNNGVKKTYRVTTSSGREVVVTANHPLYGANGWQETQKFKVGDHIAVPRHLPVVGEAYYEPQMMKLLGYLLGDGGCSQSAINFTNIDPDVIADFESVLPHSTQMVRRDHMTVSVTAKERRTNHRGFSCPTEMQWLVREWGINKLAKHKSIPEFVFELKNDYIALMLNRLFACDGWVDNKGIGIGLASKKMVRDIQHLLLRFGILSRMRYKAVRLNDKIFDSWALSVIDLDSMRAFSDNIGIFSKQEKLDALIALKGTQGIHNRKDVIPNFDASSGHPGHISRFRAQDMACKSGIETNKAFSDIYWDCVKSIEYVGEEETYDITVDGTHNFIAEDIFLHNSVAGAPWLLEEMRQRGPGLYMVVAPTYPILFDSAYNQIINLFENLLGLGKPRSKPFSFVISREGEELLFRGTQYENMTNRPQTVIRFCHGTSAASLEAKTALAVWIDEAGQEEFKLEAFEAIEGRVSTTEGRILMTSTPYGLGWLYQRFYLQWESAGKQHQDIDVIQWPSYYNPAFSRREYDRLKAVMPRWRFDMFYNGLFTRPSGLIYDTFSEATHCIEPFPIPEHWPRYLGMDFGGSNTAAVYLAQDPDSGTIYLYRSYRQSEKEGGKSVNQHIKSLCAPSEHSEYDDYFERSTGGQASEGVWRNLYNDGGLPLEEPFLKGKGSIEAGIDIVYALLSRPHAFKVFSDQELFIKEMNEYSREIDAETGEVISGTIKDQNKFHLLDGIRYICGLLFRSPSGVEARVGSRIPVNGEYLRSGEVASSALLGSYVAESPDRFNSPIGSGNGTEAQRRGISNDDWIEGEIVDGSRMGQLGGAGFNPLSLPPPTFSMPF